MTYDQAHPKWRTRDRIIGNLPLVLFVPALMAHLFSDISFAFPQGYPAWLMLGVIFLAAAVHRFFEPLPPADEARRLPKTRKRNKWITFFLFAALLHLTVGLSGLMQVAFP